MTSNSCTKNQSPQPEVRPNQPEDSSQAPSVSDPIPKCTEPEQENEEKPKRGDHMPSSSGSVAHADENGRMAITTVRASVIALNLRRIPAGFYTVVQHSGLEWRTANNRLSVNNNTVEWSGLIPIPSDPSATIYLAIYASFGFQPMLGKGELLRELSATVEQLLDHSANGHPFTFSSDEDDVSPCSSVLVTVRPWKGESSNPSASRDLHPHCLVTECLGELENTTDAGHSALSRYLKHGRKQDLDCSIEQFELSLNICPLDHPCRAVVQSNMAMAKYLLCQVDDTDVSHDVPITLYHDVLSARPVGHVDRPSTLIRLAMVHFARFEKLRDEADAAQAEELLYETVDLSIADSFEKQFAISCLRSHGRQRMESSHLPVQWDPSASFVDEDPWTRGEESLKRFQRFGDLNDLERAIPLLQELIKSTSIQHWQYPGRLARFGLALLYRFEHLGEVADLEHAISRFGDAVQLTPDSHPRKPGRLHILGTSFGVRFEHFGELSDLERAISMQRGSIDLAPDDDPDKPAWLNNLSISILTRFKHLGEISDLEQAISIQEQVADLTPDDHPDWPARLNNLVVFSLTRFKHLGELSDLERAISTQKNVVDLTPDGHPGKPSLLTNLGNSLLTRFKHFGQLSDLEQAISMQHDAVNLTPDGHPDKPGCLNNLGDCFVARFDRIGELGDLEQAISVQSHAVRLTPDRHPDKPVWLNNLGTFLSTRFNRLGELSDLEQAISIKKAAVDLTSDGHPDKPARLTNLGNAFLTRFKRLGQLGDLEQAILRQRDAVQLIPDGHTDKVACLANLANCLWTRFARVGELSDLDEAISMQSAVVDLIHDRHPDKPAWLNHLGTFLATRFDRLGQLSDLERAIAIQGEAVNLTPDNHPDEPARLSNFGNSLRDRFERFGELSDLERAISVQGKAVDLTPDGHPNKPGQLKNLATSFLARFVRLGEVSDLEHAILMQEDAVDLTPDGHPAKPGNLTNLGNTLLIRFKCLGELSDLEQAISIQEQVVDLTPDDHPAKLARLNNLAISSFTRFDHLGELSDLERAISMQENVVDLTPDGQPDKARWLINLGIFLKARFEKLGEPNDLERAISIQGNAVDLTPAGHPDKPASLSSLGNCFLIRFEHRGELSDLGRAVSTQADAVDLTSDRHVAKPGRLINLSNSFLARFERLGELSDLERAFSMRMVAADLTPDGHPDKPDCQIAVGHCFKARFQRLGELNDLKRAILFYYQGASASTSPALTRFHASLYWISCARAIGHHSLLHAYSVAIGLLPQLAWTGLSITHRYKELTQGHADVVREAAAFALDLGLPETAVEWLEQGRSIVWGDLFQLRSSYEELSAIYPDHASRLQQLSTALEQASVLREKSFSSLSELSHQTTESLQQVADRHRAFAIKRDELLQEIRRLPGFEQFLLHKKFSRLRASAHSGPVVILNAAERRCDALIILADVENVIHVPLPNFTLERSTNLQTSLKSMVRHARGMPHDEREGYSMPQPHIGRWEAILSSLWKCIAKPVLDSLAFVTPGKQSRIFWCPTGPFTFLPIHAAGFYNPHFSEPGHKTFDFVISSYVPTLGSLMPPPKLSAPASDSLCFLAVPQPPSDGLHSLPGVRTELKNIRTVIRDSPSACTTILESSVGTVEEVLELMKQADWVHFACHGIQDTARPTDSGLCLANERRLKLSDIIALSRPRGGLAFLSACQTATGDKTLSDEAIHIAAGMLFAGYGGVVGTMWSISDKLAPNVAKDVYGELFSGGARPDYREAARALQDAVGRLRESGASFSEWLPFIHVGL